MPKNQASEDAPPADPRQLADWFAQGVRAEIDALKKDGQAQKFELLSGRRVGSQGDTLFEFVIADGKRIPEDSRGSLRFGDVDAEVSIVGQDGNRILVFFVSSLSASFIPRAVLTVDDTWVLASLAQVLDEVVSGTLFVGPLVLQPFHPSLARLGQGALPGYPRVTDEKRGVIEQAIGSSLTYVWGPPGTGKTFLIAYLLAVFIEAGKRVLVTSHTNAAVDQALYESIKRDDGETGPLALSPCVGDGRVVRFGKPTSSRIPDSVRFDRILEKKSQHRQAELDSMEREAADLRKRHSALAGDLELLSKLDKAVKNFDEGHRRLESSRSLLSHNQAVTAEAQKRLKGRQAGLWTAQAAWFFKTSRIASAAFALRQAESAFRAANEAQIARQKEHEELRRWLAEMASYIQQLKATVAPIGSREAVQSKAGAVETDLRAIEQRIKTLRDELDRLALQVLNEARAVFCTLTKGFASKEMKIQEFDAVIVDEISMALPPTIFLVARQALENVVLVGDFLQLPPIVRSDAEISNSRLRQDVFHLSGVAKGLQAVKGSRVLRSLSIQKRMAPPIADIARYLVYDTAGGRLSDDPSIGTRPPLPWESVFGVDPVLVIDTVDLQSWSGKQAGSLSRFNFYSAALSVELASIAASAIPRPPDGSAPPIGIVTPYAAQRGLITGRLNDLELNDWVRAGTVHTFQGGEAELLIFDSVLDDPYWGARLTNPQNRQDVLRDLNVAVTRAKRRFIFVGSSEWLNRHAPPTSALGRLWGYLRDHAPLMSAYEFVDKWQLSRAAAAGSTLWQVPLSAADGPIDQHLDETTFFPQFFADLGGASKSIFGLVPYFGEFRWPQVQPLIAAALGRGVEVTLVTLLPSEASNRDYVEKAIKNLRELGAVVVPSEGLHGKDVIIDEEIVYTGSLNWASHRGRIEEMHRFVSREFAARELRLLQWKFIRQAGMGGPNGPRTCPKCGGATRIVNQRRQHGAWDFQPLKIGCAEPSCQSYLRNLDERAPFFAVPTCLRDSRTRYRRTALGRGEVWRCPKHPKECPSFKVVPGDAA